MRNIILTKNNWYRKEPLNFNLEICATSSQQCQNRGWLWPSMRRKDRQWFAWALFDRRSYAGNPGGSRPCIPLLPVWLSKHDLHQRAVFAKRVQNLNHFAKISLLIPRYLKELVFWNINIFPAFSSIVLSCVQQPICLRHNTCPAPYLPFRYTSNGMSNGIGTRQTPSTEAISSYIHF